MKRVLILIAIALISVGFISASITSSAIDNTTGVKEQDQEELVNNEETEIEIPITARVLTENQVRSVMAAKNKINVTSKAWQSCPYGCTCAGSTVKCQVTGGREMTVYAGKSGNMIIQVKNDTMNTNVTLYRAQGQLYGVFKGNQTKAVRMLPDQVKERVKERIQARLQNENIVLNENGEYEYRANKEARLFYIFKVKERVTARISAETGEVIRLNKSWWGFLARDVKEEPVVGASCGTVTPGQNDACCQSKGYDVWNSETQECEFTISE